MSNNGPRRRRNIHGPAQREPESDCLKLAMECVGQATVAVATALGTFVKGPLGWLLAALVVGVGLLSVAALVWLRDQTRW
jgi:hypothetical protein